MRKKKVGHTGDRTGGKNRTRNEAEIKAKPKRLKSRKDKVETERTKEKKVWRGGRGDGEREGSERRSCQHMYVMMR